MQRASDGILASLKSRCCLSGLHFCRTGIYGSNIQQTRKISTSNEHGDLGRLNEYFMQTVVSDSRMLKVRHTTGHASSTSSIVCPERLDNQSRLALQLQHLEERPKYSSCLCGRSRHHGRTAHLPHLGYVSLLLKACSNLFTVR